jgi:hypothetical protein
MGCPRREGSVVIVAKLIACRAVLFTSNVVRSCLSTYPTTSVCSWRVQFELMTAVFRLAACFFRYPFMSRSPGSLVVTAKQSCTCVFVRFPYHCFAEVLGRRNLTSFLADVKGGLMYQALLSACLKITSVSNSPDTRERSTYLVVGDCLQAAVLETSVLDECVVLYLYWYCASAGEHLSHDSVYLLSEA